jgi:hypothetical protein
VTELARAHTQDAIKALVAALTNPRERVQAAIAILDRAYGKPQQHVSTTNETTVTTQHLLAARAVALELPMIDVPTAPTLRRRARAEREGEAADV